MKPTPRQQRCLRELAASRGQTFTPPKTRAEASAEISRLLAAQRGTRLDRVLERAIDRDHLDAAAIQPHEIHGYGGQAHWAHSAERTR